MVLVSALALRWAFLHLCCFGQEEKEKAYDCPNLKEPHIWADGELHRCMPEDIKELTEFIELFYKGTKVDQDSPEAYRPLRSSEKIRPSTPVITPSFPERPLTEPVLK